ncbi:ABC transporter substrate-binding protein, partial [Collinsella aerofaciens]|nr:ABC transporter substrate-binding protein [Collinsella aerofaciens]
MNCEKEPFNDHKVRQAINYALNQQEVIDVVLEGRGQVANSVMIVNIRGYSEEITGYSQDL